MGRHLSLHIKDLNHLEAFARLLAEHLRPGDLLALRGEMGAGKTALTQRLGLALGVAERVVSPTFALVHDYLSGQCPLVHADLYRLGPEGAETVAEEILSAVEERTAIVVVEWANYGEFLAPLTTLALTLTVAPDETRVIDVETDHPEILNALQRFANT